jgi:DNA segregation ATPase FtsK/SpoIIIE, S-DNA-T family
MAQQVTGDRYVDPALLTKSLVLRPKVRVPWWVYYPYLTVKLSLKYGWLTLFYSLYRFGYVGIPALALGVLFVVYDWPVGVATVTLAAAGLVAWWWKARQSFWRWLGWFYVAQWRRWWLYYRHWYATCANLGLALSFDGDQYFPRIVKVRRDAEGDLVIVRMINGQVPDQWSKHATAFAHTFGAASCVVRPLSGRWRRHRLVLHLRVFDSLDKTFAPFVIAAVPEVAALPVALRAGGRKVTISLLTHVLIAGASGSGKGSVLWAILSALAAGVRVRSQGRGRVRLGAAVVSPVLLRRAGGDGRRFGGSGQADEASPGGSTRPGPHPCRHGRRTHAGDRH